MYHTIIMFVLLRVWTCLHWYCAAVLGIIIDHRLLSHTLYFIIFWFIKIKIENNRTDLEFEMQIMFLTIVLNDHLELGNG